MINATAEALKTWSSVPTILDEGWTPLHLATKCNNDMFRFLIEEIGADMMAKTKSGTTVLHKSALDDNNYAITYLIEKAKHPLAVFDSQGNTPLHLACSTGAE
jgi:ankyrin repeat protein